MERTITAPEREVPVICECDVLVLGAGMSGFSAAVSAARSGANVILCDKNHYPGGVATSGLMCSITNYFVTKDGTQITTGLPIEFINRLVKEGGAQGNFLRATQPQIPNEPEITKRVMIEMLCEANVTTIYEAMLVDVVMKNGLVTHCIFQGRDISFAIKAQQFVDASGDLSIFHRAGGQYISNEDGSTLCFRMENVNIDEIINWLEAHPDSYSPQKDVPTSLEDTIRNWRIYGVFHLPHHGGQQLQVVKEALEHGHFDENFGKHCKNRACFGLFSCRSNNGAVLINSNWYYGDCYDILAEGERENEGRMQIKSQAEFLIKYFPGFENAYVKESAAEIGHRRSRKAICNKLFTEHEFKDGIPADDCIGIVTEVDKRTPPYKLLEKPGQLPLSMMISNDTPNVIVGSAKNPYTEIIGMVRGQAGCLVLGRGAGIAAAIAAKYNTPVCRVDIKKVQDELKNQGMVFF